MVKILNVKNIKKAELRDILVLSLVLGFVATFSQWSYISLFGNIVIAFSLLIISLYVQKTLAIKVGAEAEFDMKWEHIIAMVVLIFITNGVFPLLLIPMVKVTPFFGRLGYKYSSLTLNERALIHSGGPITLLIISLISKPFAVFGGALYSLTFMSSAMAFFSMIPFPTFSGLELFISNRLTYIIMFFDTLVLFLLSSADFFVTFGAIAFTTIALFLVGQKLGI